VETANSAKSTGAALLELSKVDLVFGSQRVLHQVDLTIAQGEFICVVGPSGCGKTSLLRLLAGFYTPSAGKITYRGKAVSGPSQDIAIVFQDYGKALLPWRTAAGNVSLALEVAGVPKAERAARIAPLLDKMGLAQHADKFPGQMSGGMQQRLQIARALAQNPRVLLMDEPFGALDAMTRQVLQDELLSLVADTGVTVFFVTHDLEEAIYLSDRVVGLQPHPGRVGEIFNIGIDKPRDQLASREVPEFLRLRREVFDFVLAAEGRK